MALYYFTADYSGEAFSGMVNSPQDREAAARKLIEAVGMKLHNFQLIKSAKYSELCQRDTSTYLQILTIPIM